MWKILKGLYLAYKVRKYEALIRKCTQLRSKLKARQAKYSAKYELLVVQYREQLQIKK